MATIEPPICGGIARFEQGDFGRAAAQVDQSGADDKDQQGRDHQLVAKPRRKQLSPAGELDLPTPNGAALRG